MLESTEIINFLYSDRKFVVELKNNEINEQSFLDEFKNEFEKICGFIYNVMNNPSNETQEMLLEIATIPGDLTDSIVNETTSGIKSLLGMNCEFLRERKPTANKLILQFMIKKTHSDEIFTEIRVAVVGNVDSGKSTLLGVLSTGNLDDGRGSSRLKVFRHPHESTTGRTSSVGSVTVGFDESGNIVHKSHVSHARRDMGNYAEICKNSRKIIIFVDLAGHEKYLKTTVFGMMGYNPDYVMLMVGANMGTVGMTWEHLSITASIKLPVFIVVTKIDICPPNVLAETKKGISKMIREIKRKAYLIRDENDAVTAALNFQEKVCPVFLISSVNGVHLDVLSKFLNLLLQRNERNTILPTILPIDDIFRVPGVGTVVAGIIKQGKIHIGDSLLLGPMGSDGHFTPISVKSIHRQRMPIQDAIAGQSISISLKNIKRSEVRKGMVVISSKLNPTSCYEFQAKVFILHHSATITSRYNAVVHVGTVRQTAQLSPFGEDKCVLRSGEDSLVNFRFMRRPEYVEIGSRLVFREGKTRGHGIITSITPCSHFGKFSKS